MNGWNRDRFARETIEEMRRQHPEARWTNPEDNNNWVVDVGGYVNITISTQGGHMTFVLTLNEKVVQRQQPADADLIDNARALFHKAFDIVTRREVGLREA